MVASRVRVDPVGAGQIGRPALGGGGASTTTPEGSRAPADRPGQPLERRRWRGARSDAGEGGQRTAEAGLDGGDITARDLAGGRSAGGRSPATRRLDSPAGGRAGAGDPQGRRPARCGQRG